MLTMITKLNRNFFSILVLCTTLTMVVKIKVINAFLSALLSRFHVVFVKYLIKIFSTGE